MKDRGLAKKAGLMPEKSERTPESAGLTSEKTGLTSEQARRRLERDGFNALDNGKKKGIVFIFIEQFKDFLVLVLLAAASISVVLGDGKSAVVIFAVVIMNAILGTVQHVKAGHSLESLKALSAPEAKVLRDGVIVKIPSREVVLGDILFLDAGDYVSADGKIIQCASLKTNESILTGESEPVEKNVGDNVYSGSFSVYGRASILVTGTAMHTEIGKIASLIKNTSARKTPLQETMDNFGKKLSVGILIICAVVFCLSIMRGEPVFSAFMFAVALAVAAIPEALSSIVTIVLAFGTQKLAKENAVIRKLQAVEGLGSVSVICSDKTGTLTQNKMTIKKSYVNFKEIDADAYNNKNQEERFLMTAGLLCNDASVINGEEIGDPTETAMVCWGQRYGVDAEKIRNDFVRKGEVPFDSDRKLMSTVHAIEGETIMLTKGAPDVLLERIDYVADHGIRAISEKDINEIKKVCERFSLQGLRVLAFAFKNLDDLGVGGRKQADRKDLVTDEEKQEVRKDLVTDGEKQEVRKDLVTDGEKQEVRKDLVTDGEKQAVRKDLVSDEEKQAFHGVSVKDENHLIFIGLMAMMDPPREASASAVAKCIAAGIRPIMITGDYQVTAASIAEKIGILQGGGMAVEGSVIDKMTDEALEDFVEKVSVYARVTPEHKIRIVRAWQNKGQIVAMTGDGVNDAPALKQADIGVAMGITGSEVAKDASDVVLADDNFATIIKAVENGRNIYDNIQKSIKFLLSGNAAGIIAVLAASILGLALPFAPVHLLFINLLTDSLPAIALGLEPHSAEVMTKKPRPKSQSILTKQLLLQIVAEGVVIAAASMGGYFIGMQEGAEYASTMAFAVLCMSRLFHGFSCKQNAPVLFSKQMWNNRYGVGAWVLGMILLNAVLLIPSLHAAFLVADLSGAQILWIYVLAAASMAVIQTIKGIAAKC